MNNVREYFYIGLRLIQTNAAPIIIFFLNLICKITTVIRCVWPNSRISTWLHEYSRIPWKFHFYPDVNQTRIPGGLWKIVVYIYSYLSARCYSSYDGNSSIRNKSSLKFRYREEEEEGGGPDVSVKLRCLLLPTNERCCWPASITLIKTLGLLLEVMPCNQHVLPSIKLQT